MANNIQSPVYMDNHATTRVAPEVVSVMLPLFNSVYGNPGSVNHVFGWDAEELVAESRSAIAAAINASVNEIVFTSGATESNNLAIRGIAERTRRRGNHIISLRTEHHAILDPLERLGRLGWDVTFLDVAQNTNGVAGSIDLDQLADSIRDDTCLVSVMHANNEIGIIHDLAAIGNICRKAGVLFHTDATQALGRIPIDVESMKIDIMSFSAHKCYGPKGIGGLFVRKASPRVRLEPLVTGGGQENGVRSGTLNTPGIVGMAKAVSLAVDSLEVEMQRMAKLRNRLYQGLLDNIDDIVLNGPPLDQPSLRLTNNLNVSFTNVDGEALMMSMQDLAVSSGSACSSTNPEPSHVLRAIGLNDDMTRASLRFGLGRFNTAEEVEFAIAIVERSVARLRALKSI